MARLFDGFVHEFTEYSASANTSDAMYHLGLAYCAGRDVPFDLVTAHKWLNLAALRGSQEAKVRRMEISGDMTKAEIAEAQRQAREWLLKPAKPAQPVVLIKKPVSKKAGKIAMKISEPTIKAKRKAAEAIR
jgi:uncharacterized protein